MSILSSTNAGLEGSYKRVEDWLREVHITNYTLKNLSKEEKSEQPIWVIDIEDADVNKREKLLQKGDLLKFALSIRRLSKVWFENAEYDVATQKMENYILQGGLFGNNENRIAFKQQKSGGKFKYAM